jgi:hypothetical protein
MRWLGTLFVLGALVRTLEGQPPPAKEGDNEAPRAGKVSLVLETGGHTGAVIRVLFTPDGKSLITVSHDKTVRVWDLGTRLCRHVFRMPAGAATQGELYAGALSPDGTTLAVAGFGYAAEGKPVTPVYLLDLKEYRLAKVLRGHARQVHGLAFSPNGKLLASAGDDKPMRVWDVESGECVQKMEGHEGRVTDLAFCPTDGTRLASVSEDTTIRLWSVKSGKADKVLPQKLAGVDRPFGLEPRRQVAGRGRPQWRLPSRLGRRRELPQARRPRPPLFHRRAGLHGPKHPVGVGVGRVVPPGGVPRRGRQQGVADTGLYPLRQQGRALRGLGGGAGRKDLRGLR